MRRFTEFSRVIWWNVSCWMQDGDGEGQTMKRRILITDDDRCLLTAYRALLGRDADLAVDFAQSAEQAHAFMDAHAYDAACFDIELCDESEDGMDLLAQLKREHPETA